MLGRIVQNEARNDARKRTKSAPNVRLVFPHDDDARHARGSAALVPFLTVAGVEFAEFQQNPLMKSRRLESTLDAALYVVGEHPSSVIDS